MRAARRLGLMKRLNQIWSQEQAGKNSELDAASDRYELAYQMQSAAPEAVDFPRSEATRKLDAMDEEDTRAFARLLAGAR